MQAKLRDYQKYAVNFILNHKQACLFLDMGLGKTLSTLIAINDLKLLEDLGKVLIIAPLSVAKNTWPAEIKKWDQTKNLTYALILGSQDQRSKALATSKDLYIINRENIPWLVNYYKKRWPFKTVIIDELSSFKNPAAKRFKALRLVRGRITRIIGLTGTPAPNSLLDLWSEIYLLDQGERLGRTITSYRDTYFNTGQKSGYVVYNWILKPDCETKIYKKIDDIAISMKSHDYLKLPQRVNNTIKVKMTPTELGLYKKLEKEYVINIAKRGEVTASNAAVLSNKLLQLANGAIYDDDLKTIKIHDHKLNALEEITEEAQGQPILVFYQYEQDCSRILEKFPKAKKLDLNGDDIKNWNAGKIPLLLVQPQSAGHGLNLQYGGHIIVWFGLTWSLEYYQQANARLDRQGQTNSVIVHHLVTENTIDERVMNVLSGKAEKQNELLTAVKAILNE